jgi:cytosine/adenosine deaminase-related metal-dependent hydrolase
LLRRAAAPYHFFIIGPPTPAARGKFMTPSPSTRSLAARWVFPVAGPPLPGASVVIRDDRIVAVAPAGQVTPDLDLDNAAILPGFTNAHTHLDLTGLQGRCPPSPDFTAWLRQVIAHRRSQTPELVQQDIRAGLEQSLRHGVTLLGDISAGGASWPILVEAPLRAVVFHELLGLPADRADQAWHQAVAWLGTHPATPTCRPGLSPHAPYSVRASLFEQVAGSVPELPVAIHLAETAAELELLRHHRGPFADFLNEVGVWDPEGLLPDVATLLRLYRHGRPLWIHGNYLDLGLADLLSGTLVFCPRTHAAFGHAPHPLRQLRRRGVALALGTDSLASNPDLSVLEEIRFLHRHHPDLEGSWLLYLATAAGAEALGWGAETGTLAPGKSADLVVLPLPDRDEADPHQLLLNSPYPVERVLHRGRWVGNGERSIQRTQTTKKT